MQIGGERATQTRIRPTSHEYCIRHRIATDKLQHRVFLEESLIIMKHLNSRIQSTLALQENLAPRDQHSVIEVETFLAHGETFLLKCMVQIGAKI